MASLPDRLNQSSNLDLTTPQKGDKLRMYVVLASRKGWDLPELAKKLLPNDPKKRKVLRNRLRIMRNRDQRLHAMLAEEARGELAMALVPATARLGKRAARLGKPTEVKLIYEASGFHNPRVKHEHSGDINVNLNIPRPTHLSVDPEGEAIIDAEVVDED